MNKNWMATGAFMAALAVALGAFAAHGLKKIAPPDIVATFETATRYQMYHALALIGVGAFYYKHRLIKTAALLLCIGIFLFSGSLYLITYLKVSEMGSLGPIGIITPVGGLFFLAGWILFGAGLLKMK